MIVLRTYKSDSKLLVCAEIPVNLSPSMTTGVVSHLQVSGCTCTSGGALITHLWVPTAGEETSARHGADHLLIECAGQENFHIP